MLLYRRAGALFLKTVLFRVFLASNVKNSEKTVKKQRKSENNNEIILKIQVNFDGRKHVSIFVDVDG